MKIAIYQIAIERDENRLAFQSLNHIISVSNGRVPVELYDCVFAGEVSAQTLEVSSMFSTWSTLPLTKGGRSRSPMWWKYFLHQEEVSSITVSQSGSSGFALERGKPNAEHKNKSGFTAQTGGVELSAPPVA